MEKGVKRINMFFKKYTTATYLIAIVLLATILPVNGQASGWVYVRVVDKDGKPLPNAQLIINIEPYWYGYTTDDDGKASIWIDSRNLGKGLQIRVSDIFGNSLNTDVNALVFTELSQTRTVKVLNARSITVEVYDKYREVGGYSTPPLVAIVNNINSMRRTTTLDGRIKAIIINDFEGLLKIGAPLRKTTTVAVTKDRDMYQVELDHAVIVEMSFTGKELIVRVLWDSLEVRDIGDKKLVPYALDLKAVSADGKTSLIKKFSLGPFRSTSGETSVSTQLSPEQFPEELVKGAIVGAIYVEENTYTWEELNNFGQDSWIWNLVAWRPNGYIVNKKPLLESAFNPFVETLRNELDSKTQQLNEAKSEISDLESKAQELQKNLDESQKQAASLKEQLQSEIQKSSNLQSQLNEEKQKSSNLQSLLNEEAKKRQDAESRAAQLASDIEALKLDLQQSRLTLIVAATIPSVVAAVLGILYVRKKTSASL